MSKKRSWFCLIKRFFYPEVHLHHHQKCKRRRWLFGRLKSTKGLPSPDTDVVQPDSLVTEVKKLDHAEDRPKKCEEYVLNSVAKCETEVPKRADIVNNEASIVLNKGKLESCVENIAAVKIQSSYRGYLARKALRALKGFVILQALIRGRSVRRQAVTTLKCLQTIVSIQSEMCARRRLISQGKFRDLQLLDHKNEKPKDQMSRERRSDGALLTKDKEIDIILRKKEAILRRHRTKAFSFNHRNSADSDNRNAEGRLKYWLEQYVSDQHRKKEENIGGKQIEMRNTEDLNNINIVTVPRRSLQNHPKRNSYSDDALRPCSPTNLPAYMAATKSAKAKTRSVSTPRLRPVQFDAYSDGDSPYKHKLSPISSINSEVTSSTFSRVSMKSCHTPSQQKSPSLKGVPGPVRSMKNLNSTRLDFKDVPLNRGEK